MNESIFIINNQESMSLSSLLQKKKKQVAYVRLYCHKLPKPSSFIG